MSDGIKIEISSDAEQLARTFERLPKRVQTGISNGLKRSLILIEDKVRMRCRATSGDSVKFSGSRSGLSSRLTSYVKLLPGMGLDGAIGFRRTRGFPYELAQEFGAHAKPGKAMSIPVTDEARAAGGASHFPGKLRLVKTGHGAILVRDRIAGMRGMFEVEYVLVKSIPPRLGFRQTVNANTDLISGEMVAGAEGAI